MNFFNWLYPKKCVGCGKAGKYFCDQCRGQIEVDNWRFLKPMKELDGLVRCFRFKGIVGAGIKKLKYRLIADMACEWQEIVNWGLEMKYRDRRAVRFRKFLKQKPVIVAIPLFWYRKNWRGFNQSELIAGWVGCKWKLKLNLNLLIRNKATKQQAWLKKEDRLRNIKNAFVVKKVKKLPKAVLLVDDVLTSGATMKEAGKKLKKAGVKEVWGLSLA